MALNEKEEQEKREYIGAFPTEDRLIILLIMILLVISPLLPWPKTPITPATENSFSAIENVSDGGVFLWVTCFGLTTWYDLAPTEIVVFKHLFQRARDDGCKIVLGTVYTPESWIVVERILRENIQPEINYDLVYGENFVLLGWIPGFDATLAGLLTDLWVTAGNKDWQGTPLNNLPMMASIHGAGDIQLLGASIDFDPTTFIRQWGVGIGVNNVPVTLKDGSESPGALFIYNLLTGAVPLAMPYVTAGTLTSYISGQRGGAEYEQLLKEPGMGLGFMAGQSMAHFFGIALVIVVNIGYLYSRRRKSWQ